MNSFPFMPFYWNDFLSDNKVRVMSSGELGAYVRLLGAAWQEATPGTLPRDDYSLARLAGVVESAWRKISQRVLACFRWNEQAGRWEQKRMMWEYAGLVERSDRRSDSASKAAAARWGKAAQINGGANGMQSHTTGNADAMRPHANGDADAMRPQCLSESNSNSDSESTSYRDIYNAREAGGDGGTMDGGSAPAALPHAADETRPLAVANSHSLCDGGEMRNSQSSDVEVLSEAQAVDVEQGVAGEFAKMIYGDWFARGGRDGAGVAVPWLRYVAKRWAREGEDWKAGAHRSQARSQSAATSAPRGQRQTFKTEAERDFAQTGMVSTAGETLQRL